MNLDGMASSLSRRLFRSWPKYFKQLLNDVANTCN